MHNAQIDGPGVVADISPARASLPHPLTLILIGGGHRRDIYILFISTRFSRGYWPILASAADRRPGYRNRRRTLLPCRRVAVPAFPHPLHRSARWDQHPLHGRVTAVCHRRETTAT